MSSLVDGVRRKLERRPMSAPELASALNRTRREVNSVLYRHGDEFDHDDGSPPIWRMAGQAQQDVANTAGGGSAAEVPPSIPVTRSKQAALDAILEAIGSRLPLMVGAGSTEPKALFLEVDERLGLGLDPTLGKVDLARAITKRAGHDWPQNGDSQDTPSGGGDTVTLPGLRAVLTAVIHLQERKGGLGDPPSTGAPEEPDPPSDPTDGVPYREATGGIEAPPMEITQDWDALDRGTRAHAELQNQIAAAVRAAGLEPLSPSPSQPQFDIAWKPRGRFIVCEVKSTTPENARQQCRLALGQVLEYRKALEPKYPTILAAIVCSGRPPSSLVPASAAVGVRMVAGDDSMALNPLL